MKIRKIEKLITGLHEKTEYFMRIKNLKQALNPGLISKKIYYVRAIYWFEYNLRKKSEKDFEKDINE